MEDPKVPFADTTARRAQLMAATERFKTSISDSVDSMKEDAAETGKTVAFVAGAALAVYLVVNAILPKSNEYRYAEKYGEPEDALDYDEDDEDDYDADELAEDDELAATPRPARKQIKKQEEKAQKSGAVSGLVGGLVTSVLTNIAREQLTGLISRIRSNNAINPSADPTQYHQKAPTQPVDYTP